MRTAILLGATMIAKAINGFEGFPTAGVWGMIVAMLIWDLWEIKFKD